jgi:N-acyl homoserine lactone hydrolase
MKTYRIRPLALSTCEIDTGIFTYRCNYGKKVASTSYVWHIEGAAKNIIVDTGSDAKLRREFRGNKGGVDIMSFEEALAKVGLKPNDIDLVIQTHLQWDHVGNTAKCKNAKIMVQEEELNFALFPHPILASTYAKNLLKGLNYEVVRGYHEIEPGIDLIPSPGHTPGCQSVSVTTEKGRAIITGFCCINANFEPPQEMRELTPVLPSGTHMNVVDSFESAMRVKEMADILIPLHEPSLIGTQFIP